MAKVAFNRAIAGMGTPRKKDGRSTSTDATASTELGASDEDLELQDSVVLTEAVQAVRMHQLAISLRPLAGSAGRPMLTASRWEVRKAIMSLCRTPPTTFEVRKIRTRPAVLPVLPAAAPGTHLQAQN